MVVEQKARALYHFRKKKELAATEPEGQAVAFCVGKTGLFFEKLYIPGRKSPIKKWAVEETYFSLKSFKRL